MELLTWDELRLPILPQACPKATSHLDFKHICLVDMEEEVISVPCSEDFHLP